MAGKVVAIIGSYRKNGTVDQVVDTILAAARERGAAVEKIYLIDEYIEFCTNCRACAQAPGPERGKCVHQDDLEAVLARIDAADVLVLASPVNFGNVTAVFRRFMERLLGAAYWPWGQLRQPIPRNKAQTKHAVLVMSSAAPAILARLFSGAMGALKTTARVPEAKPVATLSIGLAGRHPQPRISASVLRRARLIGLSVH
jgi:multimeric flavodoxin WrbA